MRHGSVMGSAGDGVAVAPLLPSPARVVVLVTVAVLAAGCGNGCALDAAGDDGGLGQLGELGRIVEGGVFGEVGTWPSDAADLCDGEPEFAGEGGEVLVVVATLPRRVSNPADVGHAVS